MPANSQRRAKILTTSFLLFVSIVTNLSLNIFTSSFAFFCLINSFYFNFLFPTQNRFSFHVLFFLITLISSSAIFFTVQHISNHVKNRFNFSQTTSFCYETHMKRIRIIESLNVFTIFLMLNSFKMNLLSLSNLVIYQISLSLYYDPISMIVLRF